MPQSNYLLDTNTVSFIIRGQETVCSKLKKIPMSQLFISTITEAELRRGLMKKPEATRLAELVHEFLIRVTIQPWCSEAASAYATLRTECDKKGLSLGAMDMLIAAHALSLNCTLITNDQAMLKLKGIISVKDWC